MGADPPDRQTRRRVVLDRMDRDGAALARLLLARDADVAAPAPEARVTAPDGVWIVDDLVATTSSADALYVDCWTAETAPHVRTARAAGIRTTSLADLVVAESGMPVIGVTGTAGKTTTAHLVTRLLRVQGVEVECPGDGRAQNAWPGAESLTALTARTTPDYRVLELTSTHLAYMQASPTVAVVTALWPDHLELHGGLDAYVSAKGRILAAQRPGDRAVLPVGEERIAPNPGVDVLRFDPDGAAATAAVGWRGDRLVVRSEDGERTIWEGGGVSVPQRACLAAAVCACLAVERIPRSEDVEAALAVLPRWRGETIGRADGTAVVHDGMAATPAKARAAMERRGDRSVVVIVGGETESSAGLVHATPAEMRLFEDAGREIERVATAVVAYGPAAERCAALLGTWEGELVVGPDLAWAIDAAIARRMGAEAIVWSPMFPVALEDRERFEDLVRRTALAQGATWRSGEPGSAKNRA